MEESLQLLKKIKGMFILCSFICTNVEVVELPVPSHPVWSLTRPLPIPYHLVSLGLSRSHKGTGTGTIFDFSHHHPPTRKLLRSLYNSLGISYPYNTCPLPPSPYLTPHLPIPYLSLTCPLPVPYPSHTCPLPVPYLSSLPRPL